jgi:hypothetical protein
LRFVGGLPIRKALTMATDDDDECVCYANEYECMCYASEYERLAALTNYRPVRDQLLDHARGWTAVAEGERRSDDARVLTLPRRRPTH